jgi:very-short-patch-repair endonuclease
MQDEGQMTKILIGAVNRDKSPHTTTLRQNPTEAETRLWSRLRGRRLNDHKFRRQVPIGPYIVDFLCVEQRLIVEADGSQHNEEIDALRTAFLEARGYRVIRFWNQDILARTEDVLATILAYLEGQP